MTGRELAEALKCGKPSCACKGGKVVHCPVTSAHKHGDASPSMSVTEQGGKALFRCHAGCSQEDVLGALKERGLWGEQAAPTPIRTARGSLVKLYEYRDAAGNLVAEHGRFEGANGKSFAWRVPGKDWRDGLGAMPISDLPLYNLASVLELDGSVWFCEGEKATDACTEAGLLAVCLGGGASQQAFGNALDVLRDRDVILWPDNDEQGQALMGRIAALLPRARYVRPVVPPKGDAYDYFQAGGSVEALTALLEETEPWVEVADRDAVTVVVPVPAGRVRFEFTNMTAGNRAVDAEMRVVVDVPGKPRDPFNSRLNLQSSSGREGIRREIESVYGKGSDLAWASLMSKACGRAVETWRGLDYSVDLADVALPEVRRWTVERFAPENLITILFGMGGAGKSLITADIALHCLFGMPWKGRATEPVGCVLVVDYEDTSDEWRLRVHQLCQGYGWQFPEHGFRYVPGRAIPIADQMQQLKRLVEEWNIGLIIVDSAASACGGDLLDTTAVARLTNALTDLGVTSILIAHNTKAEDSKYPYGSIFWNNLVRATHYVESTQDEGSPVLEAAIHNRKGNRGLQKPIPIKVTFPDSDSGPVTIELTASLPESLKTEEQNDRWRVMRCLVEARHPLTAKEIHEETGIQESSIRTHLARGSGKWCVSTGRGLWAALSERDEEAV